MRAGSMIVVEVRREETAQMGRVEDHQVVETFTTIEPITRST